MKRQEVEAYITQLTEKLLEGTELTLVDVEYVKEKDWYLRLYIDRPEGIEIDDCQFVSEKLAEVLDAEDPIKEKYYLEVSSPGIDRPLKSDQDFVDNYGQKVDIAFYEPWEDMLTLTGFLEAHDADTIQVRKLIKGREFKKPVTIQRQLIANIRPHIDF